MTGRSRAVVALTAIVAAQALVVFGFAVFFVVEILLGNTPSPARAWFAAALVLVAAIGLALAGRGLWHGRGAARAPIVLAELLQLPVGWGLVQSGRVVLGVLVLVAALTGTVLVFTRPVLGHLGFLTSEE
ncbi:MAG: hypothetical protein ACTHNT_00860 [Actinomycetales bacterium]